MNKQMLHDQLDKLIAAVEGTPIDSGDLDLKIEVLVVAEITTDVDGISSVEESNLVIDLFRAGDFKSRQIAEIE